MTYSERECEFTSAKNFKIKINNNLSKSALIKKWRSFKSLVLSIRGTVEQQRDDIFILCSFLVN